MIRYAFQMRKANNDAGQHFFSPDAMRFFNSRVSSKIYPVPDGAVFVTSERPPDGSPRRFTVRHIFDNGHLDTADEFSDFRRYASHSGAHAAAERLAKKLRNTQP